MSFWVHAPESTNCNPTHLIATARFAFSCLFLSANKMFLFWYSKPPYATTAAIGFLSLVNLELAVSKLSAPYCYFNKLYEIISIFASITSCFLLCSQKKQFVT